MFCRMLVLPTLFWSAVLAGCRDLDSGSQGKSESVIDRSFFGAETGQCVLRIDLPSKVKIGSYAIRAIQVQNEGESDVTLVMPGDGSDCHWRTPLVGWSLIPTASMQPHPREIPRDPFSNARCGNINPLTGSDVFVLKPGESQDIRQWIDFPPGEVAPGKYRVAFYYSNVPNMKWRGAPLGEHDADAMQQLRTSTPVSLISNEVIVDVVP